MAKLEHKYSYSLEHLPEHLFEAGKEVRLRVLLARLDFLERKINAFAPKQLIDDYDLIDECSLKTIQAALRLSAHVLAQDKSFLRGQILGRLLGRQEPSIAGLLEEAKKNRGAAWLRPEHPTLVGPGGPLIRTFEGDASGVRAVIALSRGRVVCGSDAGTLRVLDTDSGVTLRSYHLSKRITALASLGDDRFVSASYDGALRLWDLVVEHTGGILLHTVGILKGHFAHKLAGIDDHRVIFASSQALGIWDVERESVQIFKEPAMAALTALTALDKDRAVFTAANDLQIWNVRTGKILQTLRGHEGLVRALAAWDDHILSASDDGTIRLWSVESEKPLGTLKGPTKGVLSLAMLDEHRAVSASIDRSLRIWDVDQGNLLQTIDSQANSAGGLAVLETGRLVSASSTGSLQLWDLDVARASDISTNGVRAPSCSGHRAAVNDVTMIDDRRVASASADHTWRLWDVKDRIMLGIFIGHKSAVNSLAVLDDRRIVSGSLDRTLRIWDLERGETDQRLDGHLGSVLALAPLTPGHIVSASADRTLKIWNVDRGEVLRTFDGHSGIVTAVVVLSSRKDEKYIISASSDRTLRIWDADTGATIRILGGHTGWVRDVVVLEDRRLVSASNDRTLRVWDPENGKTLRTLDGHSGSVEAVAVIDGVHIVSGSKDRTLRIWNVDSGETLATFVLDAPVKSVGFNSGARMVVAGDSGAGIHFLRWVQG